MTMEHGMLIVLTCAVAVILRSKEKNDVKTQKQGSLNSGQNAVRDLQKQFTREMNWSLGLFKW